MPEHNVSGEMAAGVLTRSEVEVATTDRGPLSPYFGDFRQGATVTPRMLLLVEDAPSGPLGAPAGIRPIKSRRSGDKEPWKLLPDLTGAVEEHFLTPLLLGQNVIPFGVLGTETAVIPWDGILLDGAAPKLDAYPGLARWWRAAEQLWDTHADSDMSLLRRLDWQKGATKQFPLAAQRVVYTTSGSLVAAARLLDDTVLVDTSLYWMPTTNTQEALYLVAVLNSEALLAEVVPFQPVGQFGPRHFHRYPLFPALPKYDKSNGIHRELASLSEQAETVAAEVKHTGGFQHTRKAVRDALRGAGLWEAVEERVADVLVAAAGAAFPQGGLKPNPGAGVAPVPDGPGASTHSAIVAFGRRLGGRSSGLARAGLQQALNPHDAPSR